MTTSKVRSERTSWGKIIGLSAAMPAHSLLMPPGSITMTSIPNSAEDVDLELVASLVHWDVLERAI